MLREHGVFSTAHAADLALDICDLLSTVHDEGVVHGQLGLRCVRLTMTREHGPRDVDVFALTAEGDGEPEVKALPFLAPEQQALAGPIDGRADLWAIGAIVHQIVLGVPPPAGVVTIDDPSFPSSLARIVESCLALSPAARPANVDVLTEKIASFASWPPDRFARLAERRDARERAERAKEALAARGLAHMPAVLDKLDEAAMVRAVRESELPAAPMAAAPRTVTTTSLLDLPTSTAALDRLMAVVKEGTEAARLEHAAELPDLVDFEDDDSGEQPTVLKDPDAPLDLVHEVVASPLARPSLPPALTPELLAAPASQAAPASRGSQAPQAAATTRRRRPRRVLPIVTLVGGSFVVSLAVGYLGYRLTARPEPPQSSAITSASAALRPSAAANAPVAAAAPVAPVATASSTATVSASSTATVIPTFSANALPEVAPVSPLSLPDAKKR